MDAGASLQWPGVLAMRVRDAEIPRELVDAHREKRLVLFIGAGVSRGPPSSLPLFRCLVSRVADLLIENPDRASEGDSVLWAEVMLEELVSRGLNVHGVVHEIISESTEHNLTHEAVAALAVAGGPIRLVTTNYDTHLSSCLPDVPVYRVPDVPGTANFEGVVHIHGSVDQTPNRLVVTSDDFARTYLNPDHSTLPFLHKLFASHTVLFIGYSLTDTLMQYIMKAVWEDSNLYALTKNSDLAVWADRGIIPVGYPSHDRLPWVLNEWAVRAGASFSDHDRRVSRILSPDPTSGCLALWDESYLADIISDPERVRIFTKNARGPVWFGWVGSRPEMVNLFTPGAELDSCQKVLAYWFWRHFLDDEETADAMLSLVAQHGGRLNETLWLNMTGRMTWGSAVSPETSARLMLVLAEVAPQGLDNVVLGLLNLCETPRDDLLFLQVVDRVFRPKVTPADPSRHSGSLPGQFHAATNDPSDGWLRQGLKPLWSQRPHLADELLVIVDGHLHRVHQIEDISGNPDPFADRATIAPSDQNFDLRTTDFLIDAARDLYEIVAERLPDRAISWLGSWAGSRWILLNRLAIHGWSMRSDMSPDDKIGWLLEQDNWLCDDRMLNETMQLIAGAVPDASESTIGAVIDRIVQTPDCCPPQVMLHKLAWIAKHAPNSARATSAVAQARADHPALEVSDHPDLPWRVCDMPEQPLPRYIEGTSPEDLAERLLSNPEATTAWLLAMSDENHFQEQQSSQWQRVVKTVRKATELCPAAGITMLQNLTQNAGSHPERRSAVASAVLLELVKLPPGQHPTGEHSEEADSLITRLWDTASAHWEVRPLSPSGECLHEARKLWPGLLATLAINRITAQVNSDPEPPSDPLSHDKRFLQRITATDSLEANIAQTTCARYLPALYATDRHWANQHILPMLDPANNEKQALRCWDSYLHQPTTNPGLLDDGLLTHFKTFVRYADHCCGDARRMFAHLAAALCVADAKHNPDRPPEWLKGFSADASAAIRAEFIRYTAKVLRERDQTKRTEEWHRWMRRYWQRRLKALPQHCTEQEKSALIEWVTLLDEDYPAAVDMVLKVPTSLPEDLNRATSWFPSIIRTDQMPDPFDQYPDATGKLIAHLLENTDLETAQKWEIPIVTAVAELRHQISAATFNPVWEQLLRLGWTHAVQSQDFG